MAEPESTLTTGARAARPPAPPGDPRLTLVFLVLCTGFVMANLDMMIVNVAFPAIQRDLSGATVAGLSWTLTGYSIVFAALLVPAGRLADRYGRRPGFLLSLAVFTAASALCAVAQAAPMLVAARVLQAIGAAGLVPTSLGILLATWPPHRRDAAVRAWISVGGVAAALAPIIGGALVAAGWRWIFLINLPIGAAGLLIGRRVLPHARTGEPGPLPDFAGAVLLVLGVGAVTLGLVQAPEWGWSSGRAGGCLVGAVVLLAAFVLRSARHPVPVVPLSLLRVPAFAMANLATLAFGVCFSAMLFSVVLFSEDVWGYSPLRAGLALAPGTLLMPLVAVLSGRLIGRLGQAAVIALGCGLLAGGVLWWALTAQTRPHYFGTLLPGAVLTAVGSILAVGTLVAAATRDLPPPSLSTGSAVNSMVRQVGFVIGVSVFVAALGAPDTAAQAREAFQRGWLIAAACGAGAMVLGLLVPAAATRKPSRRRDRADRTAP
ncbi:MFS transporter [Paractinoplanes deccanensis]|uniref:MFS transporter n=1 Tax=Paractinoplanes deccanensis TaxID=113561 RepID=A0ABQ3XY76_9ACTN|nr:MFS transporter [Actinoplanes deccanensis]GID72703.1 MFS transporter [Actinoplanes deccanensis]